MSAKDRARSSEGDQHGTVANSTSDEGGGTLADGGPGLAYMPFVVMEDLLDKLKLLNYEEVNLKGDNLETAFKCLPAEFVKELRMRPLSRHYFVLQTNPGEQFFLFTSLAAWLIRKSGRQFEPPQEFDDPNSTIANILDNVRQIGVAIDFPPSKLKQGYGEQAIFVLDRLSDEALRSINFQWGRPMPPQEVTEDDEEEIDEAELNLDKVEEEMAADYSDEEEDEILHIDEFSTLMNTAGVTVGTSSSGGVSNLAAASAALGSLPQRPEEILQSTTDAEAWNLEVERVAPQLKVTVKVDSRDWRSHLEQMHTYRDGIEQALESTKSQLDKLHTDVSRTLEKISSREKYLNSQLEAPLSDLRQLQDNLAATKEQYRQVSGGVTERSSMLAQISDELEAVKSEMEERGSSMTDGTPLVNIRKTLGRLKQEIVTMDVRIGVVEHTLLQAKLKDKSNMQRDMHSLHFQNEDSAYY